MYVNIVEAEEKDLQAVCDFWNDRVDAPNSIWRFAPKVDVDHIKAKIGQGYRCFVAFDSGDQFVGYGMWRNEYTLGIAAINAEIYYKIGRVWARQNPGAVGRVRFPNIVCDERTWLDEMVPLQYTPESFKPLKPGEDVSQRKTWTFMVTWSLDDMDRLITERYGE